MIHNQENQETEWNVRLAILEDMPRLVEIYSYYVEETCVSFEYETPTLEEFTERFLSISKKYPYIVIESRGVIEGYAYANTFKGRAAYDWSVETTIYLEKSCRGEGRGQVLYAELEKYLKMQNILNANACVSNSHSESVKFHKKMGFEMVAHFHKCGYKLGKWHDMVWMEKIIGEHKEDMPNVIWFENLI